MKTQVQLFHRHYGEHTFVKREVITTKRSLVSNETVDEATLLAALPPKFLPVEASRVLLTIGNEHGSTGCVGLRLFHSWAKYFDAYVLEVVPPYVQRKREKAQGLA